MSEVTLTRAMIEGEIARLKLEGAASQYKVEIAVLALERLDMEPKDGQMLGLGDGRYVCFGGRWHGWEFRKHPDGQFVSVAQRQFEVPISSLPKPKGA